MKFLTENQEWVSFYPNFNSSFYVEKAGYFDERPQVHTSVTQVAVLICLPLLLLQSVLFLLLVPFVFFGWGKLYINLPIKTGIQDCESAAWGFNYHGNKIWIYIGGAGNFEGGRKWKTFTMPWDLTWVRTSTLMKDGNEWFHETNKNRRSWIGDTSGNEVGSHDWLNINKWKETHPFIDRFDNTTVNATISVEEREWRPLWFMWTSVFAKKRRTISIEFDKQVGKKKGSFKGGVLGCSYDLFPSETPVECLKRMETNREL